MDSYRGWSLTKYTEEQIDAYWTNLDHQRILAFRRDNGLCRACYTEKKSRKAECVHHVFGHGSPRNLTNEQYNRLLCLCEQCHVKYHSQSRDRAGMVALLEQANREPLSPHFQPDRDLALLQAPGQLAPACY